MLNKYVRRGLPGIAVSVRDEQGEWTGTAGKADLAKNVPMQPCHLTKVASITKMCIATLTLMLVEEGTLNLDDKLTQWLPGEVTRRLPGSDQITLFQLLAHRTGLYDFADNEGFSLSLINHPGKTWTQHEILKFVYDKPAAFRPGARADYSNTNTLLVTMVIEQAMGRSHAELLRKRILEPLGMSNTYYQGHDKLPENRIAQGYIDLYNDNTITNVSNYNTGSGNGFGGLLSTVNDLQLFINALFVQKTLVTQQSLNQMMRFSPTSSPDKQLGAGISKEFINKSPDGYAYGHSGGDLGYTSDLQWFPEKRVSLALLVNFGTRRNSSLNATFDKFRKELADLIVE